MLCQMIIIYERFVTLVTFENFIPGVHFELMCDQIAFLSKYLVTVVALESFRIIM